MNDALKEMQDRQEIIDLTIAYGWLLDHGPRERLDTVFTPDAVADYMGLICEGLPSILEKVTSALGPLDASQHIVSNQLVTIDGDTATCKCYLHAQHTVYGLEGGENMVIAGRYEDELVRTPDGWRIAFRKLISDWTEGNPNVRGGGKG